MSGLILGGTYEARKLAIALAQHDQSVCLSLAGATKHPAPTPLPTRVGGFGGAGGFANYLRDHAPRWVVDATHPFAAKMTQTAASVCAELGCPYLRLERPAWQAQDKDSWIFVDDLDALGDIIPHKQVIFAATGRQTASYYASLTQNTIYLRVIDPPSAPSTHSHLHYVQGAPPFSVADEIAVFKRLKVDYLVVKNAGGDAPRSKLDAAAQLNMPVILQNRPNMTVEPKVETVQAASDWIEQHD